MAKLEWDKTGSKFFETGIDHGVLYPNNGPGVPWNGLISIEEQVSGGETEAYYFDGIKYFDDVAVEDFQASLRAFTYPDEFAACEGSTTIVPGFVAEYQTRQTFGLAWRTRAGNDVDGVEHGSQIHIVYNATAAPSSKAYETLSDSPTPVEFEWTINAVPPLPGQGLGNSGGDPNVDFLDWMWPPGYGMPGWPKGPDGNTLVDGWWAMPYVVIDEQDVVPDVYVSLVDRLNGTPETLPYLPSPLDLVNLLNGFDIPDAPLDPNYVPPVDPNPGSDGYGVPESAWANAASVRPYQSLGRPGGNDNFYAAAVTGGALSLSDDNVDTFIAFGPYIPPTTKIACADARFHTLPFVPSDVRVRFNVSLNLTLRDRHITPMLQMFLTNMDNSVTIISDTSQSIDLFNIKTDPVTGFDYIEYTFHGWNNTFNPDAWAKVLSGEFYAGLNNQTIDSGDSNSTPDFWIHEMWLYYAPPAQKQNGSGVELGTPITMTQSSNTEWTKPPMLFGGADPLPLVTDDGDATYIRTTYYRESTVNGAGQGVGATQNYFSVPLVSTGDNSQISGMELKFRVRCGNDYGSTHSGFYFDIHDEDFNVEYDLDTVDSVLNDGLWHEYTFTITNQKIKDWKRGDDAYVQSFWDALRAGDIRMDCFETGSALITAPQHRWADYSKIEVRAL